MYSRHKSWARTLSEDVLTLPKFPFLYPFNQLSHSGDLDQHDDHIIFLLKHEIPNPHTQKETHFRRRRWLIAVRLTIYIDHLDTILVSDGHSDGIPKVGWRCSSWLLLHPLRTRSDLNLVNSDLTGGRKLDGTWVATKANACRPESKVRRRSAI
jgi:hypothetical protein